MSTTDLARRSAVVGVSVAPRSVAREDGGCGAYLPDLPGVVALGTTREEVSDRIREAVAVYAEEMADLGRPLPEPVAPTGTIRAA